MLMPKGLVKPSFIMPFDLQKVKKIVTWYVPCYFQVLQPDTLENATYEKRWQF